MMRISSPEQSATDARRSLVQRIVASSNFNRSPRLADFLVYICDCALDGREDEISEQQIGVQVFKRAANYNPNDDSIVRSHARLLRQKLDAYFEHEGSHEELRISIPKGRYVPCFEPFEPKIDSNGTWETVPGRVSEAPGRKWPWIWTAVAIGAAALAVLIAQLVWFGPKARTSPHAFWKTFFSSGKKVLIVPADSALALVEDITHRQIGLTDYLNHRYHFDAVKTPGWDEAALNRIASRNYTSLADLSLTARLVRLPEAGSHPIEIRYARNLQLADLKEGSAVLIGGPRANPWEDLFQNKMNFFVDTDLVTLENRISNKKPLPGEQKTYGEPQGDIPPARAYGLVALLPGLRASTRTLVVEGTSSIGTECAADFLLDETALGNFITEISKHIDAKRTWPPFFEVVLETAAVAGSAPQPQIVAYRLIPE